MIKLLQTAISPIVLISGVGLLLVSLNNRMGRIIDRSRFLVEEIEAGKADKQKHTQIRILYKRSRIMRISITFISLTIFFASIMILMLLLGYFTLVNIFSFFIICFVAAVICLILAVLLFLVDISLNLKALKLQVKDCIK